MFFTLSKILGFFLKAYNLIFFSILIYILLSKSRLYFLRMMSYFFGFLALFVIIIGGFSYIHNYLIWKFENFIEDMVLRMYENTSTIMKLKKYLEFKLNEWPESEKAVWWKIGERWEIQETGEKGNCYYPDAKSFLENVDYNFSVQIIKKCWKRACSTGELFPEDEAIKDCAKNHMNGWILD